MVFLGKFDLIWFDLCAEMSSKKEEERNEKIIRGLMKLPPNRKCINCNSLVSFFVSSLFFVLMYF